jgi:hypothetical protein
MKSLVLICLVLACVAGCGKTDKADNSHIQSPNDQPIGEPSGPGGKTLTLDGKQEKLIGGQNAVKKIEIKNEKH